MDPMTNAPTSPGDAAEDYKAPIHPKVASAAAAGAITTVLVFVAEAFGVDVSPEVAAAVTTIIGFLAGYMR